MAYEKEGEFEPLNDDELRLKSVIEQRDIFKEMQKDNYKPALLNFWNYLMGNGYLEEGINGEAVINTYLKKK